MFLGRPDVVRCPGCGYLGPPPAEAQGPLRHAAHVLSSIDQRHRQLSAAQRRTLLLGRRRAGCFTCLALLLGLPFACLSLMALLTLVTGKGTWSDVLFGAGPLLGFGSAVLVLGLWARVARGALERAAVAFPPSAPGEPASCHVCGGPVPVGVEPLVRCAYCGADNLVEPAALQRAGSKRALALDAWENDIERHARAAATTTRAASALLLPAAVVFPAVALVGGALVLLSIEHPAAESVEYTERATAKGQLCVARVRRDGAAVRLDWEHRPPEGESDTPVPAPPEMRPFRASSVLGKELLGRFSGKPARVQRIYTTQLDQEANQVDLLSATGERTTQPLAGSCLPSGSAPAPGDAGSPADAGAP
jgi:hypothetical protein